ncbi:hypothetical protein GQX74_008844 [Glossina fuscipes]|nr:hypothetical protein GQX74_008844 [Glossina fuscipes]
MRQKTNSGLPPYGGRDDSMSDERIAHILNEASSMMKSSVSSGLQHQLKDEQQRRVHEDSHSNEDSKSPLQPCPSPFFKEQIKQTQDSCIQSQSNPHIRQEDVNPEKMARLYQEIMTRAPREAFPSGGLPAAAGMPGNTFSGLAADESMRLAFEREMVKLQQQAQPPNFPNFSSLMALQQQMLNGAQDLSLGKETAVKELKTNGQRNSFTSSQTSLENSSAVAQQNTTNAKDSSTPSVERLYPGMCKSDTGNNTPASQPSANTPALNANSAAPSPLSNTILPPAMTSNDDFSTTASPLQRMASITNSLITQPPVPPHHPQPQRPTKAVLPPITQQQFDMFNNLNTEDIVRRVKEALSQYSISQRLFGESVLGLSQGSVSDLLARPKPWHMLTQKGREPFIRMKMFLEDENAVHKLVASQYKIAPEKLMRTGNYSGTPQIPQGLANKMQGTLPMQKMINDLKLQEPTQAQQIMQQMQAAAVMSAAMQQQHQAQQSQHQAVAQAAQAVAQAAQHHQSMLLTSPGLPPQHAIPLPAATTNPNSSVPTTASGPSGEKKPMIMPIHSPHTPNAMRNLHQHMSPTVYEMAALTQDLDTQVITTKIKEALLTNNIGQKIFGEAVLGLSQGSVSELLSKPKPWHMLSIKGREPFIRMQLWLSDANNVERLQVLKNERREASKRRRSTGPNQQDNSSDTSSNDTNDFYTSSPGPGSVGSSVSGPTPNKKQRVLFSEEQKEALRLAFALDPYPNVGTIEFLANELGLATRTITNWFHNHRMRLKQQVPHGPPGAENPIPSRENTNSTPFDPVQFRILLQQRLLELHKERMGLTGTNPLPYPPYFAAAALLSRSLAGIPNATPAVPGIAGESEIHALNQAFKEQMSGLDLSMSSLKRERTDDFEDDLEEGHLSENDNDSLDEDDKSGDYKDTPRSSISSSDRFFGANMRSNKRKRAAPQWVNPAAVGLNATPTTESSDRLINGVCIMQSNQRTEPISDQNEEEIHKTQTSEDQEIVHSDIMEPEVVIKQEKADCESDSEQNSALTKSKEDKIKVMQEEKLRMVRVSRLSNEEEQISTASTWNY